MRPQDLTDAQLVEIRTVLAQKLATQAEIAAHLGLSQPEISRLVGRRRPKGVDRFWSKVDRRGPDECWLWTASTFWDGYGQFKLNGRPVRAHRVAWERMNGPLPAGYDVDHAVCSTRLCCNPAHLEPVPPGENTRRAQYRAHENGSALKTACVHGHAYTPENTGRHPTRGHRFCRACDRERKRQ